MINIIFPATGRGKYSKAIAVMLAVSIVAICITVQSAGAQIKSRKTEYTVIIDAGHGGFDGGAVSESGITEKEINLSIAEKLENLLTFYGYNCIMTRTDDNAIGNSDGGKATKSADMKKRVEIMNKYDGAIFISIHQNKFTEDAGVKGFQAFYRADDENGKLLANSVQTAIRENIDKENNRKEKADTRGIFILKNAKIPAIIAECGFLSNTEDLQNLCSEHYKNRLAFTLAGGINNYFETQNR